MEDITTLWDWFNHAAGERWMELSDELLEAGYSWQYSSADNCYRLLDLFEYFNQRKDPSHDYPV